MRDRQRNGWHHTHDLGKREADGSLSFIGPKTQMIKSGAENVYPAEVEGCLRQHPAVADCAVIGVPDATWVQSVKAIVLLKPGAQVDAQALIEHCRERIASYKKPRFVEFADDVAAHCRRRRRLQGARCGVRRRRLSRRLDARRLS